MGKSTRPPRRIRKRDGALVPFDSSRIEEAVFRALQEVRRPDRELARAVTDRAVFELATRFPRRPPGVEDAQDAVEEALMALGVPDAARAYVLYRRRRAELREAKRLLGVRDELKLSLNAVTILADRYLLRDEEGRVVESTAEMMERVAGFVAQAEQSFRGGSSARLAEAFTELLLSLRFLPNSPTLMNAGTSLGLLSACVVLPVEDSLDGIFSTLRLAALVHQAGGGTGFSFSRLRPAGDLVRSTLGRASGPVSFVGVFDAAAEVIRRGGRRRGASMAVLDVSHPDIEEFVTAKDEGGRLETFNLSVGVSDAFVRAARANGSHALVNPRTGRLVRRVKAAELLELIATSAWRSGEPGMLFLDRINRANPVPLLGRIEATNPCGEVPLHPYESCNLGSLNLMRFVEGGRLDWTRLGETVRLAVRFLDDVIEVSRYPAPELEQAARATRKVGLGIMGLAELLASLGLPYDSEAGVRVAARIARFIRREARLASAALAAERGPFPLFPDSVYARRAFPPLRNAQLTAVAPTGTISAIAGTTSGIEPMFALAYARNVLGSRLLEANSLFERVARRRGFYSDELIAEIAASGGVRGNPRVPEDVRRAFVTALEISPEWHVRMQAAVQRHVDASVSKTVNLPTQATVDDVRRLFLAAWDARVKGITVYRYGSRTDQVLTLLGDGQQPGARIQVETAYAGGCARPACEL